MASILDPFSLLLSHSFVLKEANCHIVSCPLERATWQGNKGLYLFCSFTMFFRFHIQVNSCGICLSLTYFTKIIPSMSPHAIINGREKFRLKKKSLWPTNIRELNPVNGNEKSLLLTNHHAMNPVRNWIQPTTSSVSLAVNLPRLELQMRSQLTGKWNFRRDFRQGHQLSCAQILSTDQLWDNKYLLFYATRVWGNLLHISR